MWTEEQWNIVHFNDECKYNLFGADGKRFLRCKNGECINKTVKIGEGA